ncbi:hypothetical protein OG411_30080 [Streptomyces pseudogriseolus]|uniref:hypothetical protein n=1 Tax=Streptomyces pseudogriseolus TaxID=36817 RepID=UPI00324DF4EF
MAAISVGSVEVDVVPNTRGIRTQLQSALVPAANQVGDELGRIMGRHIQTQIAQAVRSGVTTGGRTATPQAARSGQQAGGAFGRTFRSRVQAAMQNLPRAEVRIGESGFNADMARLRARLETLSNKRIGVDVDAGTALAEVERLQQQLRRLGANHPDVNVRVDTGQAIAELEALRREINRLDGRTANVDVDTRSAAANLNLLATAALAFGPAILPALPVVAAGLGAVAAAAVAAGAGIGGIALVAVPAFKQIGTVLQAQKAAQDAATNATYQGGQAAAQAASRANQLASAQAAVASAERNGARQIAQAQKAVTDARRGAAQAAAQASQRAAQAARAVEDAEEALGDAQRDARRAQEDLTAARRTAARELQDLNSQLAGSVLDQRDAELSLREATAERDKVLKNANATELDKQRALLAYDQAVQRLKDQRTETARLKQETEAANKAGVEGSTTVKSAQERLAEAQEQVADRTQALRDAQAEQARTAVENAQRIADAQQRIADAQQGVADAQVQAAEQAAAAQRQLSQAQQAGAGTVDQAAIAQAKYRAELAKLTPAARQTMLAYTGLRDAFSEWSRSLQPAVMPIFTRALNGMKNALPGLTPFVLEASSAIQGLMDRASAELKTPFWRGFKEDLQGAVKPAIEGLGVSFGNVFKGMAGVVGAFLPHMDTISGRMQNLTGRFADWGASLKDSPEFRDFLSYSSDMAPKLGEALKEIAGAALKIAQAMSPISSIVLGVVTKVADGIGWLAEKAPWLVQTIYGIAIAFTTWRIAMALWAAVTRGAAVAMALFNAAMALSPLTWIIIGVVAVVAVIALLWNKCDWFRNAIKAVWRAIQNAALAAWDWLKSNVLFPIRDFFTKTVPGWARSLRDGVVGAWNSAYSGILSAWGWIKKYILIPVRDFFTKTIPGWARSLAGKVAEQWNSMTAGLSDGWGWLKKNVLYPIRDFFTKTVPGWGTTLKNKLIDAFELAADGIGTAFSEIRSAARKPVQYVVDVVYNNGIRGVWNRVAGAFGAPKLSYYKFASGGVMPGYTPGRDVHRFVSPTGGALELSGGEAIMRPEFTRAVGSGFVHSLNSVARSRGSEGVKAALAPILGGNPRTPTDTSLRYARGGVFPVQRFADGGIFGWIKDRASDAVGAGSAAWNKLKEGASWLGDTLESSARAGVKKVVEPLLKRFPGMDTGFGRLIRRIPNRVIDALFGYSKEADKRGGSGIGGPRIQAALRWAKTQHGKPYQWGGNGNPSWDCSGFMSAIESVIRGQKPHRRWATMAFSGRTAPPGWVKNGNSAFRVGITNAGVGHTAGTLGKTNVESRGGDGVVVGSRARGYSDGLFTDWYGFMPGKYDNGGMLQPGFNLAYNGTGRPEPVLTGAQFNALARGGQQVGDLQVTVYVGDQQITDIARAEVRTAQGELIQTLNAG